MTTLVSPLWRWAVTDLAGETITFLDKLASDRTVQPNLNAPLELHGTVPSDSPEINMLHTDNLPLLSEGVRQLYGFRREADVNPYYTIRASTLILQTTDATGSGDCRTSFTAWDPWQYLFYRPIYVDTGEGGDLSLVPRKGWTYSPISYTADQIVMEWLGGMQSMADVTAPFAAQNGFIDFGQLGTVPGPTIETCGVFADPGYHIEPGTSIGQAMQDICATGAMDIVLTPVYDPVSRPGILCELNIYAQDSDPDSGAGERNYEAVFAWDRPGRSSVGFSDLFDGTERANQVQFRNGSAGPLVALQSDPDSIALYGEYWAEQAFPAQSKAPAVVTIAQEQLALRKTYKQTLTVNPAPERSPEPFVDYGLGDRVPIYIGMSQRGTYQLGDNSSRQSLPFGYTGAAPSPDPGVYVWQRIYGIPIDLDDNGVETVRELLVGPIGPPVSPSAPGQGGNEELSAAGGSEPGIGLTAAVGASTGVLARQNRRNTVATTQDHALPQRHRRHPVTAPYERIYIPQAVGQNRDRVRKLELADQLALLDGWAVLDPITLEYIIEDDNSSPTGYTVSSPDSIAQESTVSCWVDFVAIGGWTPGSGTVFLAKMDPQPGAGLLGVPLGFGVSVDASTGAQTIIYFRISTFSPDAASDYIEAVVATTGVAVGPGVPYTWATGDHVWYGAFTYYVDPPESIP